MAKPLRPKRGTTAKNDAFTGLANEITLDTEKHSLRIHDGVTAGGVAEILPKDQNDERYSTKAETSEAVGNCLPLSGGTMTGKIETSENESVSLSVESGNAYVVKAERTDTGKRVSFGVGLSGQARGIYDNSTNQWLVSFDEENVLKTQGKKVFTEEGGTFTGTDIGFSGAGTISSGSSSHQLTIRNGSSASQGAGLWLYGNDNAGEGKARIQVYDVANSAYRVFDAKPDGSLTWLGKNIVRSVNGADADASGNVTISAGGWKQISSVTVTLKTTSDHTATFSGLTSGRPVMFKFYAQNNYGYPRKCHARIKSGLTAGPITGADGSTGSNSTSDFPNVVLAQVAKNSTPTFISSYPLLATGTSCSLLLQSHNVSSSANYNITVTAYQW